MLQEIQVDPSNGIKVWCDESRKIKKQNGKEKSKRVRRTRWSLGRDAKTGRRISFGIRPASISDIDESDEEIESFRQESHDQVESETKENDERNAAHSERRHRQSRAHSRRPSDTVAHLSDMSYEEAKVADHYKLLGLEPGASKKDIRKAFRRLVFVLHPDKALSSANRGAWMILLEGKKC